MGGRGCVCVCGLCLGAMWRSLITLEVMEIKSMSLGESNICLFLDSRLFSFRKADFSRSFLRTGAVHIKGVI